MEPAFDADPAAARCKHLIAAGAMADRRSCPRQAHHLVGLEVNSMGEPRPLAEPSAILEIVKRAAAIDVFAIAVLILGFGEVSMQPDLFPRS